MVGGNAPVSSAGGVWILLQPYIKSEQVLQCPSEANPPEGPKSSAYTDYQYNLLLGLDQKTSAPRGLAVSALTQPALTVLANDSPACYPDGSTPGCAGYPNPTYTCAAGKAMYTSSPLGPCQRHMKGQNFLFTDGHVAAYRGETPTKSAEVWNYATPGSTSLSDPTYNTRP
jgi:prepilin-type processing-associated H-X9-DG protein